MLNNSNIHLRLIQLHCANEQKVLILYNSVTFDCFACTATIVNVDCSQSERLVHCLKNLRNDHLSFMQILMKFNRIAAVVVYRFCSLHNSTRQARTHTHTPLKTAFPSESRIIFSHKKAEQ